MPGNHPRLFVMAATHVTHILPLRPSPHPSLSSFRLVFFLLLPLLLFLLPHRSPLPLSPSPPSFSSSSSYHIGVHPIPRIIHILHQPRVRGKFLNFARIENFHILFLWRSGTGPRAADWLAGCSQSSSSSSRSRHATAAIVLKNFPRRRSSVRRTPGDVCRSIDDRGKQARGIWVSREESGEMRLRGISTRKCLFLSLVVA